MMGTLFDPDEEVETIEGLAFDPLPPEGDERTLEERFREFVAKNPGVYRHLVSMAHELRRKGHTKIGIGMLFEVLRWQSMLSTSDPSSTFKLNNSYRSRFARLIMENEPELDGIFDTRVLKT